MFTTGGSIFSAASLKSVHEIEAPGCNSFQPGQSLDANADSFDIQRPTAERDTPLDRDSLSPAGRR